MHVECSQSAESNRPIACDEHRLSARVGGIFDGRLLKTERASNYKLAATWMTPDVIRATARMLQVTERITDDQARALVAQAEKAGDTVVIIEIDPREGSGVIPNDWAAFLQADVPDFAEPRAARGVDTPNVGEAVTLAWQSASAKAPARQAAKAGPAAKRRPGRAKITGRRPASSKRRARTRP